MNNAKLRQLYIWFGLIVHEMQPGLTRQEFDELLHWSKRFTQRVNPENHGGMFSDGDNGEWPDTLFEQWEALK